MQEDIKYLKLFGGKALNAKETDKAKAARWVDAWSLEAAKMTVGKGEKSDL